MAHVEVLVGSPSDLHFVKESQLPVIFEKAGVTFSVSACSAHRNVDQLHDRVLATLADTTAYVCAAGMAAALPGSVKAMVLTRKHMNVYGIALPSQDFPDARDAELGITRLPPGLPVEYCGIGAEGFSAAASLIVDSLDDLPSADEAARLLEADIAAIKQPQFDIDIAAS